MNFETVQIAKIKPAAYNPRKLSEQGLIDLVGSITTLGFILPIIINRDNLTIVAGHQRTTAAKAIKLTEVPAFYIRGVDLHDEILFNQIHNGIEYEPKVSGTCNESRERGFHTLPIKSFDCPDYNVIVANEICRLIIKYGDPLCAIVCEGEVVFGNNYIYACKTLNSDAHVSFINKDELGKFRYYFSRQYGVFNYEKVERQDYVQGLAQPNRAGGVDWSPLYRTVLPAIAKLGKEIHVLDFGCGKGAFIGKMNKVLGYRNTVGLEFFNHNRVGISIERGQLMIDRFIQSIKRHGLFDVVICDAVINSVNSQEAEDAVMGCLNTFCKPGGKIFFSGRRREDIEGRYNYKKAATIERYIHFPDTNGLSAILREGQWYFQKFLYEDQVDAIIAKNNLLPFNRYNSSGYFGVGATKISNISREDMIKSIDFEFDLDLPNNQRYGRQNEVKELLRLM